MAVNNDELDSAAKAEIIRLAKAEYLRTHEDATPTKVAAILFDQCAQDAEQDRKSPTPLSRGDIKSRLDAYYPRGSYTADALQQAPYRVRNALAKFWYDHPEEAPVWALRFAGPTETSRRGARARSGQYFLTPEIQPYVERRPANLQKVSPRHRQRSAQSNGVPPEAFAHLVGRCFCCNQTKDPFLGPTLCDNKACFAATVPAAHQQALATVFGERRGADYSSGLPLTKELIDFFAAEIGSRPAMLRKELHGLFPFPEDHLTKAGLKVGSPFLYPAPYLSRTFQDVWVLDMSTYLWSCGLKDPKSWAVVNIAIQNGISTLLAATAGNVGLSLTRLAYHANRRLGTAIEVCSLLDGSVSPNIANTLQSWGGRVLTVPSYGVHGASPGDAWQAARSADIKGGWYVTDGWDGIGPAIYRLLFAQVLRRASFDYVVVPVGTGNLLLGAYLGVRDSGSKATVVGALPVGHNILSDAGELGLSVNHQLPSFDETSVPVAPKLVRWYSALSACAAALTHDERVTFLDVYRDMQYQAARSLRQSTSRAIAAEPSALISFGALNGVGLHDGIAEMALRSTGQSHPAKIDSRVLVVNSGAGILADEEAAFFDSV